MAKESKPYRGTRRDPYTIVLEEVRSNFRAFGEGLQFLNMKFDKMDGRMGSLELKVDSIVDDIQNMKTDLRIIKNTILDHNDQLQDHEGRIVNLENS